MPKAGTVHITVNDNEGLAHDYSLKPEVHRALLTHIYGQKKPLNGVVKCKVSFSSHSIKL